VHYPSTTLYIHDPAASAEATCKLRVSILQLVHAGSICTVHAGLIQNGTATKLTSHESMLVLP
jgi:hypothetical protein